VSFMLADYARSASRRRPSVATCRRWRIRSWAGVCLAGICAVTDVAMLVTDDSADPAGVEAILRAGTEVVVARS
jgi:hypothetical protein